ncbi:MAG: DUF1232 domain-containing protein [Deltaproteobacteria bacterium]|nr:DUF1232 domain-containing protein [Deltaproteobacteria bacterium]
MPSKKPARKASASPSKPKAKPQPAAPAAPRQTVLDRSDIHRILFDLAHQVAPADLETLMDNEAMLIERARGLTDANLALFQKQLSLAMACVRDHVDGECSQIPYYTISLIGAALMYFADEFDAIPDFLPDIGHLDDAVVMAMACELGADGLQRYCDFKDIDATGLLPPRRN